jgi:hypothetical protein
LPRRGYGALHEYWTDFQLPVPTVGKMEHKSKESPVSNADWDAVSTRLICIDTLSGNTHCLCVLAYHMALDRRTDVSTTAF